MKEALISIITSEFNEPTMLQGSLDPLTAYPDSFWTLWNRGTDGAAFYDNDARSFVWSFDVFYYSTDPSLVNTRMQQLRTLLKANGWIVQGVGYDAMSDEPTHTGRGITVLYIEQNTLQNSQEEEQPK